MTVDRFTPVLVAAQFVAWYEAIAREPEPDFAAEY